MELVMLELQPLCLMMLTKMSFGTKGQKVDKISRDRLDKVLTKAMLKLLSLAQLQIEQAVEKVVLSLVEELDTELSDYLIFLSFFLKTSG